MRNLITVLAVTVAGVALPAGVAQASVPEGGDTRPCVTAREGNLIGGLHQTRRQVRRIVDTRGVVVSDHAFDGWNADAGIAPKDEYATAPRYRQIRRYTVCPEVVAREGRYVYVEYRVRYGTSRVEQARWTDEEVLPYTVVMPTPDPVLVPPTQ